MKTEKLTAETLRLEVPLAVVSTKQIVGLQIGGYLRYLDAEHLALEPICRLLGWDRKDVMTYLRSGKQGVPRHHLFRYGRFIYESTWGVHHIDITMWLMAELKNMDSHDCLYARLLIIQIMANAGIHTLTSEVEAMLVPIIEQLEDEDTEFAGMVHSYLAATLPNSYKQVMKRLVCVILPDIT